MAGKCNKYSTYCYGIRTFVQKSYYYMNLPVLGNVYQFRKQMCH